MKCIHCVNEGTLFQGEYYCPFHLKELKKRLNLWKCEGCGKEHYAEGEQQFKWCFDCCKIIGLK